MGRFLDAGRRRGQDPLGPTSTAPVRLPDSTLGGVLAKRWGTRALGKKLRSEGSGDGVWNNGAADEGTDADALGAGG